MLGFYQTLMLRNDKVFSNCDVEKCQGIYGAIMLENARLFGTLRT